jgi:hypothetical protein
MSTHRRRRFQRARRQVRRELERRGVSTAWMADRGVVNLTRDPFAGFMPILERAFRGAYAGVLHDHAHLFEAPPKGPAK